MKVKITWEDNKDAYQFTYAGHSTEEIMNVMVNDLSRVFSPNELGQVAELIDLMVADTRNRLSKTINDKYITILINYEPVIAHNIFSFAFEPELTSFSEDIGSEYETLDTDDYVDRMGDYLEEFLDYDIETISSFTLKDLAVFNDSPLFDTIKRSKLNIQFQRSGFRITCSYTLEIYDSNFNKGLIEELEEELENTIPLAFENSLGAHEDISTEISGYMVEYCFDVNLVI